LFDLAGYTVDGAVSELPTSPVTLWRGVIPEHRNGWSWTYDRDLAQWFADRPHHVGRGRVWVADVDLTFVRTVCGLNKGVGPKTPGQRATRPSYPSSTSTRHTYQVRSPPTRQHPLMALSGSLMADGKMKGWPVFASPFSR
jgi:hypothetical protein